MKTAVNVYVTGLETSTNFENKVAKQINDKLMEYGKDPMQVIVINDVGMSWGGRGQYKQNIELEIDGAEYNFSVHSTDSQLYDEIGDTDNPTMYSNMMKRLVLSIISDKLENIADEIMDNREEKLNNN